MNKINIIIVESSDIMANGIAALFNKHPGITVAGKATSHSALSTLLKSTSCDVVLLGPIISEKFLHDLPNELKNDFPLARFVEVSLSEDLPEITDRIKRAFTE